MKRVDQKRIERRLRLSYRRLRAYRVIINEIRALEKKYINDPDILDALLSIESFLNKIMEKLMNSISVNKKKLEEAEKKPI